MSPPNLLIYMPPHEFELLSSSLYGDEHGLGERTLSLNMLSREKRVDLRMPVICKYKDNMPTFVTDRVSKEKWFDLCGLVLEESTFKIVLSTGSFDYRARIAHQDIKPLKQDRTRTIFEWIDEEEDAVAVLKEGLHWIRSRLC
ncbi:hypothetical protein ACN47E_001636 [Coniothyrium glycines]